MKYEKAIKDLEQMKQNYLDMDICLGLVQSLNLAIEALEKQTPTKPNYIYGDEPLCPYCQEVLDDGDVICDSCHQLIDWSE